MTNLAFPPIPARYDADERLGAQITLLAGQINAANHRLLKLIAEFDQRKAWSGGDTVRSCAHWLNWKCGIALVAARERAPIATTLALAAIVREVLAALPARVREEAGDDPVRRTFQALRIEVNDELGALRAFLAALPSCVAPGGRVAILTFHSGEDRLVKKSFQAGARDGIWVEWSREPVRPGPEELRANPRSRPAKLRTALRAGAAVSRTS